MDNLSAYQLLVNPGVKYRLRRHVLLWSTTVLLNFEGFYFLSGSIKDTSSYSEVWYSIIACLLFGVFIFGAYWAITTLAHRFILIRFAPSRFITGLFLIHLLASELVLIHFHLFIHYITLARLPRFYTTYANHLIHLPFWLAPFDTILVFFFSFSFFYNYVLFAVGFKVFKDLFTIQLQQIDLKRENLRLELDFLKAQINPHFLFNTLNNIYAFSIHTPQKVEASLLKLADLMRYTLYETKEQQVPLRNEIVFLTSYLDLQRIRHDEQVVIQFMVDGEPTTQVVPPLLLITFVENAFKHGIQTTTQTAWVTIQLKLTVNTLSLKVSNSVPAHRPAKSSGIGLTNVRKRLDYLFPHRHRLLIRNEPSEFHISLDLDLYEANLSSYHSGR